MSESTAGAAGDGRRRFHRWAPKAAAAIDVALALCLLSAVNDDDRGSQANGSRASSASARSRARRVFEWFWRGAAVREWQRSTTLAGDRSPELPLRSTLSADLARVAVTTPAPLGEAAGCELYRQAIYWALCALAKAGDATSGYSDSIWAGLDDELLLPLAATVEERQVLRARLRDGNFVTFAELPSAEQAACRAAFSDLHAALVVRFEGTHRGLLALRRQRAFRLLALLACLLAVLVSVRMVRARAARGGDLAFDTEWRTSSSYGVGGCASPEQECEGKAGWFFHTSESDTNSWIEFNFGSSKAVSTVVIENRDDCCAERAVPLAIEVSDDRKHWHSVVVRRQEFATWRATFPTVQARWLRLRLLHHGPLHLKSVHIYP